MKKTLFVSALASTLLLVCAPVAIGQYFGNDSSSLRCPGGLIYVNDPARYIRKKCGPPTRETYNSDSRAQVWVYHFGTSRFINYVSIVNDKIHRIQSTPCDGDNPDCE
jgi:hypothetical protein